MCIACEVAKLPPTVIEQTVSLALLGGTTGLTALRLISKREFNRIMRPIRRFMESRYEVAHRQHR